MLTTKARSVRLKRKDGTITDVTLVEGPSEVVTMSAESLPDIGGSSSSPVGYCIYCGARDGLTKEHIVPFGLNGTAVLPEASCPRCSTITGKFEGKVLRGPLVDVRKMLGLQSRSKHESAPADAELLLIKDGNPLVVRVPLGEYPIILSFPTFAVPHCLTGVEASGINLKGVASILFGPPPDEVIRRFDAQTIDLQDRPSEPVEFARMLAKIAYCFAVKNDVLKKLDGPCLVLPAILGQKDDIGHWVGTIDGPFRTYPGILHRLEIHEDQEKGLLIVEVQLFAHSQTPSYGIVLGRLRP